MAGTGATLTYRELDDGSRRLARLMWERGLRPGDQVALLMGNHLRFLEVYWAAMRSGLYFTPVNTYLTPDEVRYVVDNCGAAALIVDGRLADVAETLADLPKVVLRLALDAPVAGFEDYDAALATTTAEVLTMQPLGLAMVYSSGSTGRPKGVRRELSGRTVEEGHPHFVRWMRDLYDGSDQTVYLTPAPLYHAAPLSFASTITALGGTVVLMGRFDAANCLKTIQTYGVTHAQFVPTMFVRLLRLPEAVREATDLSSLRIVIHGAGSCPQHVKRSMIDWFGPILLEYYAGSEDNGTTMIKTQEWLEHPGSVGRSIAGSTVHICDTAGDELPAGTDGIVYFESDGGRADFEYVGEFERTASSRHPHHGTWTTLGDIGHLDEEGYLYLTDRRDHLIISGGVNISPQEVENAILGHERVVDVAVFGLPDEEYGELVVAVVQPTEAQAEEDGLAEDVLAYLRDRLARHKIPRAVYVVEALPRSPTGKLNKKRLRESYLPIETSEVQS